MFQVATCSNDHPKLQQPQQPLEPQQSQDPQQPEQPQLAQQPPAPKVIATSPHVQALLLGDQQAEIDWLTSVAAQWSTEEPCRADNTNFYTRRHWSSHQWSTLTISLVT